MAWGKPFVTKKSALSDYWIIFKVIINMIKKQNNKKIPTWTLKICKYRIKRLHLILLRNNYWIVKSKYNFFIYLFIMVYYGLIVNAIDAWYFLFRCFASISNWILKI
jgi:hypothetical protein